MTGHGVAALCWLVSGLVPAPARFWLWSVAFLIDLGTPWMAVRHSVDLPHNEHHLPERFGLFTIILFGEGIIAVMTGMESQEEWPIEAALSALLSMALLFMLWWWYFDGAAGASEQPVRTRREALRFHVWTYAHLPLYLATVVAGIGLNKLVTAASHSVLDPHEVLLLTSAMAAVMLMLTLIGAMSASRLEPTRGWAHGALAAGAMGLGLSGVMASTALIVVLAGICLAHLVVSLSGLPLLWRLADINPPIVPRPAADTAPGSRSG